MYSVFVGLLFFESIFNSCPCWSLSDHELQLKLLDFESGGELLKMFLKKDLQSGIQHFNEDDEISSLIRYHLFY